MLSCQAGFPPVETMPSTSKASLMVMGKPCKEPNFDLEAVFLSASLAFSKALSASNATTALIDGFTFSTCFKKDSRTSSAETSFCFIFLRISCAFSKIIMPINSLLNIS